MISGVPPWEVFVVTAPGLEAITAAEVSALGIRPGGTEPGGLTLAGDLHILGLLHLHLRTASRILVRVARFRAVGFRDLERRARDVPWRDFVAPGADPGALVFDVTCRKSRLYHSGAVEERLRKAAEVALAGAERSPGPSPGGAGSSAGSAPRFVVRLHRNVLTVSADASGVPLHRRGYREAVAKAPLRETLAAALILAAEWRGETPLADPLCGAGTILLEAALLARGIPPGAGRHFAFHGWPAAGGTGAPVPPPPDPHPATAGGAGVQASPPIVGSDRDAGAIQAARSNAERAGVEGAVAFSQASVSEAPLPGPGSLIVTNPPYGHRVGEREGLRDLYARLGHRLRAECPGGRVVLLSADRALTGQLGLETRVLFRTRNGGIPVEAVSARIP